MAQKHVLKESYCRKFKIESFFTGNKIEISSDGEYVLSVCNSSLNILSAITGRVVNQLKSDDEDNIITFALSNDSNTVVIAHQSGLLRQWLLSSNEQKLEHRLERTWKSIHSAPISVLTFSSSGTLLATASADATIKVWDVLNNYFTHNLKGAKGVFSVVKFSNYDSKNNHYYIYGAADDYSVHVWDLITSRHVTKLDAHCSKVTAIEFTNDKKYILTASRDKLVIVWNAILHQKVRSIPIFEPIESLQIINGNKISVIEINSENKDVFVTGGERGVLRVWNIESGALLHTQQNSLLSLETEEQNKAELITQCIYCERTEQIAVVSFENNIILHKIADLSPVKQFIGNIEEVLDIKLLGENNTHIAVATNSPNIKLFELSTCNCYLLKAHTDIVLSLVTFPFDAYTLISSSKDNSVKVWKFSPQDMSAICYYTGTGHSHSVTTIATSNVRTFFISAGEDTTIKMWKIPKKESTDDFKKGIGIALSAKITQHSHDKCVNTVAISPNDQLIASGSQDKTAKIWSTDDLKLLGVIRGHRRGIWCVQFSPVDQVLVTASADATVKIWTLNDYSCIKTFEGHDCSVLKVIFIDRGMQMISSATDGNLKIWNIKQNECVKTVDAHNDKIWALTQSSDEKMLITGSSDSCISVWDDVTAKEIEEKTVKLEAHVQSDQTLTNLIHKKKWSKALKLAINLDYQFRALNIIKEILIDDNGINEIESVLSKLRSDQLITLFNYAIVWNTNSKHYVCAQCVLKSIWCKVPPNELIKSQDFKLNIEKLLPYNERHFTRLSRLQQYVTFIDFIWEKVKLPDVRVNDLTDKISKVNFDQIYDTDVNSKELENNNDDCDEIICEDSD